MAGQYFVLIDYSDDCQGWCFENADNSPKAKDGYATATEALTAAIKRAVGQNFIIIKLVEFEERNNK